MSSQDPTNPDYGRDDQRTPTSPYAAPQQEGGASPYGASSQPDAPSYGQQPYDQDAQGQSAYGQSPYAQAEQPGYGQHAQAPYGQPYAGPDPSRLAGWGSRVGANLLDNLLLLPAYLVSMVGVGMIGAGAPADTEVYAETADQMATMTGASGGDPTMVTTGAIVALVGFALMLALWIWNRVVRQGRGQSWGKKVTHQRLVDARTGQPVGAGKAFLRELAHYLDGAVFYLGYLWPLWDKQRQTFADKICSTVVVKD